MAVTHLKAKTGSENEDRRLAQVQAILGHCETMLASNGSAPLVFMGDFNTDPHDVKDHSAKAVPVVTSWRGGALSSRR